MRPLWTSHFTPLRPYHLTMRQKDMWTASSRSLSIDVQCCRGLSIVFLQLKDRLELFVKRRELVPGSGFLSHCEVDAK